jgi:hypothetical protein
MDSSTNLDATGDALRLQTFQVRAYIVIVLQAPTLVQGKFDVKDFVGAFSEKLIAQSKADPGRMWINSPIPTPSLRV